jgi:TonB family protein
MRQHMYLLTLLCALFASVPCAAQQEAPTPLAVTAFDCPKYPAKAQSMRLQGMVKLEVATDGHNVANIKVTSGHPVLAEAAQKNVQTWRFAEHKATSFLVTFYYVSEGKFRRDKSTNCDAKLDLPTKVTVSTQFPFP